ncbi:MAG: hypothetical protein V4692_11515, partial [Bdellovibrionota bacterium]
MVGRYFLIPGITSLVILFAFPLDANAKTTISVVDGYSTLDTTTSTTPAAYGGTAGLDCSGGDSVCSNCNVAFGSTCNTRRMNPALILRITVSSDTIATGNVQIWGPASTTSPLTSNAVPAIIAKGATSTLSI